MENIIKIVTCPYCNSLAENAVETECCQSIYCEPCSANQKACLACNKNSKYIKSLAIRKIVDSLDDNCNYCGETFKHKFSKDHTKSCPLVPKPCSICNTLVLNEELPNHIFSSHADFVNSILFSNKEENYFGPRINASGNLSKFGSNGKYYCSQKMDYKCGCCKGFCGPVNGCNCSDCQALDIKLRNLPKGYYVNKYGFICKMTVAGFYCESLSTVSENYCNPKGLRCEACKIFQKNFRFIQKKVSNILNS